jgi:dTDP-4-amino-4,6-dideoxygalactose transaminase
MRNFGFNGARRLFFAELGLNAKENSEFHAAMGLVNLGHIREIHENRKRITERYDQKLIGFKELNQSSVISKGV